MFGVIDVAAQCVQRHTAFTIPFGAGDFSATQTAGTGDLDALGTQTQRRLHGALHGAAERDAALQLIAHTGGHQLGVDFRLADFNDVQAHVAAGHLGDLLAQLLDVRTLLADDHAGARSKDGHAAQLGRTLDHHLGDGGLAMMLDDELADAQIFQQQVAILVALGEPAAVPGAVDLQAQTDGGRLVTH